MMGYLRRAKAASAEIEARVCEIRSDEYLADGSWKPAFNDKGKAVIGNYLVYGVAHAQAPTVAVLIAGVTLVAVQRWASLVRRRQLKLKNATDEISHRTNRRDGTPSENAETQYDRTQHVAGKNAVELGAANNGAGRQTPYSHRAPNENVENAALNRQEIGLEEQDAISPPPDNDIPADDQGRQGQLDRSFVIDAISTIETFVEQRVRPGASLLLSVEDSGEATRRKNVLFQLICNPPRDIRDARSIAGDEGQRRIAAAAEQVRSNYEKGRLYALERVLSDLFGVRVLLRDQNGDLVMTRRGNHARAFPGCTPKEACILTIAIIGIQRLHQNGGGPVTEAMRAELQPMIRRFLRSENTTRGNENFSMLRQAISNDHPVRTNARRIEESIKALHIDELYNMLHLISSGGDARPHQPVNWLALYRSGVNQGRGVRQRASRVQLLTRAREELLEMLAFQPLPLPLSLPELEALLAEYEGTSAAEGPDGPVPRTPS
jgi:hypothetical protein